MTPVFRSVAGAVALFFLVGCATAGGEREARKSPAGMEGTDLKPIAETYVKLVLAVGRHDTDYVDAYYGPPEWKQEAENTQLSLRIISRQAAALLTQLDGQSVPATDEMENLRRRYLRRQLDALAARVRMLQGERLSFDEESRALYDAVAPTHNEEYFRRILDGLDGLLPGEGSIAARYEDFRLQFVIPADRLDDLFQAAIAACRERTARHLSLPAGESFVVEYVTDKSWSGYNWYQGNYRSLIQVNTDFPIYIDRAIDLACHEGYPGHHVYNVLLEKNLVRERGWMEFSVYPLFSPQSLIAEGSANYGIRMAFPGDERVRFERENLFSLAGLDPGGAERYYRIQDLYRQLNYAGNEAARRYLDGRIDAGQAADWLGLYALFSPSRAKQRVRFIDQYRSYVINYNLGQDLVRDYVESTAGANASPDRKWAVFGELLSSPRLPSDLTPSAGRAPAAEGS